jgi:hypothetical protein
LEGFALCDLPFSIAISGIVGLVLRDAERRMAQQRLRRLVGLKKLRFRLKKLVIAARGVPR